VRRIQVAISSDTEPELERRCRALLGVPFGLLGPGDQDQIVSPGPFA
jgi:hypothetical protein